MKKKNFIWPLPEYRDVLSADERGRASDSSKIIPIIAKKVLQILCMFKSFFLLKTQKQGWKWCVEVDNYFINVLGQKLRINLLKTEKTITTINWYFMVVRFLQHTLGSAKQRITIVTDHAYKSKLRYQIDYQLRVTYGNPVP